MEENGFEVEPLQEEATPIVVELKKREGRIVFPKRPLLLSNFPREVAEKFLNLGEECYYNPDEEIINSREIGNSLYLIGEGEVSVYRTNIKLANLGKGDVFGELVIFRDHYRIASVKAEKPSILLKYPRHVIMDFFAHQDQKLFYIYTVNIIEILRRKLIATNRKVCELERKLLLLQ